ncbi:unnamed protein product [Dovyalis caffra]|uniref:TCP transcription factor n=1 Tax=Dovyalis caffra TaxID=77055 RepID=A0AAV1R0C1_9ROSI|nr:unnamed protein product [Dovyalis caffra]
MIASTFTDTENPSSMEDYSPTSFLQQFPDPFFDDDDILVRELLSQHYQQEVLGSNTHALAVETQETNPAPPNEETRKISNKNKKGNINTPKQPIRQRRTGKKDRHSKIHTAQGPRDRRMRLSLQIARKFFDLQDMLGFDKASKTIEWLFTKSKAAIKEVTDSVSRVRKSSSTSAGGKSVSSTSESEVVSGIKLAPDTNGDMRLMEAKSDSLAIKPKEKRSKKAHKPAFNPVDRESREKARARARDRTREKLKSKGIDKSSQSSQANPNNLENFGCYSPLEHGENLASGSQEINSSVKIVGEEEESSNHHLLPPHQVDSVSIIDKFFGITNSPRSSLIFDFSESVAVPSGANLKDEFSEFPVNWDVTNGRVQYKYSAQPNMKLTTGNVQSQNPNAMFMTTPHALEQKSAMLITTSNAHIEESPNSVFMNMPNPNEQNPISILMTTTTNDNGNQFSSDPSFARDYDCLY